MSAVSSPQQYLVMPSNFHERLAYLPKDNPIEIMEKVRCYREPTTNLSTERFALMLESSRMQFTKLDTPSLQSSINMLGPDPMQFFIPIQSSPQSFNTCGGNLSSTGTCSPTIDEDNCCSCFFRWIKNNILDPILNIFKLIFCCRCNTEPISSPENTLQNEEDNEQVIETVDEESENCLSPEPSH
jgi:hypothetical protein